MRSSSPSAARARRAPDFFSFLEGLTIQVEAQELRQLALGLVYFRYLSEAFAERWAEIERETHNPRSLLFCLREEQRIAMLERASSYRSKKVIWVPPAARWARLKEVASRPNGNVGRAVDAAIITFERDNPALQGFFPRDYARPELGREALLRLIEEISRVGEGEERPALALSRLCEGFRGGTGRLALVPPPPQVRDEPAHRFANVLDRLDAQLKELDHQLQESQAFRARAGRP